MGYFSSIAYDIEMAKETFRSRERKIINEPVEKLADCQYSLWGQTDSDKSFTKEEITAILLDDYKAPAWNTAVNKLTSPKDTTTGYIPVYTKK